MARLGISLYTRLTGMNTARRMAHKKETAIREAAIAYQGLTLGFALLLDEKRK
jgi:hypothetical protein